MTAAHCLEICRHVHKFGIPVHMDGARIFNAAAALDTAVADLTRECDTVQFCLSKGLGAPVGSVLLGTRDLIAEARSWRKRLGGGMRQVGVLAAAGLIALETSPSRLHEDHDNARKLAEALAEMPGVSIDVAGVVTNIVIFDVSAANEPAATICAKLKEQGVLAINFGNKIRMVTHCDVSAADIESTIDILRKILF